MERNARENYPVLKRLKAVEYSQIICSDGFAVGNRGAARVFDVHKNESSSEQQLKAQVKSAKGAGSLRKNKRRHAARGAEVEEEVYDWISHNREGV